MKLYHAASIALVGWYLLFPPTSRDHPTGNADAPLSEWGKRPTTFRDEAECEHVLDRNRRVVNKSNRQVGLRFYKKAQCVSADDPRLRAK